MQSTSPPHARVASSNRSVAQVQATPSRALLFSLLPRLGSTAISVRNRVYASPPCFLGNDRFLIWQASPSAVAMGELWCRLGEHTFAISANGLGRIEPRLEGFESFIPAEMCTALVEHALNPVIGLLERASGLTVEGEEFRRGSAPQSVGDEVTVGFVVMEDPKQALLRGWVRASADVWAGLDFSRALHLPTRRHLSLPVRLSIEMGRCLISARELSQLRPGDALRPDGKVLRQAQSLPVLLTNSSGRFSMAARIDGHDFYLENRVSTSFDQDSSAAPGDGDGEDMLSDIECDLSFELGSMRLTVAEIARMRAGQTLRLGVRLQEQPVRLLVNGRLIGRGELAAVGDELVVVVTDTSKLPNV